MITRREFIAGAVVLSGCTGSSSPPNIAAPNPPAPTTPGSMANNQLVASDSFASGSLAPGWVKLPGVTATCQVVGTGPTAVAEPTTLSVEAGQMWTGTAFPNDQTSQCVLGAGWVQESGTTAQLWVRAQSAVNSGYAISLAATSGSAGAATITVYRIDAGTATQLGASVTGLTAAAGDLWTVQMQGPCLVVYQNFKNVFFWVDITYASGSPGFALISSVNVAHAQVGMWRGYNAVQQDGIWQKRGALNIPLVASDINTGTSFVNSGVDSQSVPLYEGNAQILSGTVYKMWFGTASGIQYAESTDAINWSRFGSTLIAGFTFPQIFKNAGTYYLYAQSNTVAAGTGPITVFTSTNGITWTNQGSTGITLGTTGQWDATAVYLFTPFQIVGGTWSAFYTGVNASNAFGMGLATSSNGLTWTKSGGNPVAPSIFVGMPYLINGVWYMWGGTVPPGQATLNPTAGIRMQSTNLTTWTNRIVSVQHSQQTEGVNTTVGFCGASSLITVGNQTYQFMSSGPSNSVSNTGASWTATLAVANAPMSTIVLGNENGLQQTAADNFQRANGSLGANWATPATAGALQIASNLVEPSVTGSHCAAAYIAGGISAQAQYSEVTVSAMSGSNAQCTPMCYMQLGSLSGYMAFWGGVAGSQGTGSTFVAKFVSGVFTTIGPSTTVTPQVGDVIRLTVIPNPDGSNVLSLYQNGFLILQAQDYAQSFTSGYPGVDMFNSTAVTDSQISSWDGGNANVSPFPSGGGSGDLGPGYDFKFRL